MSTHNPLLLRAVMASTGPVLELGAGLSSTPLLHWLCKMLDRELWTYETDQDYWKMANEFRSRSHHIRRVDNWDQADILMNWGVSLVDHAPAKRRIVDIKRLNGRCDYIVIHDTEKECVYGYDQIWPLFKYRFDWKECVPYTTVVSNLFPLDSFAHEKPVVLHQPC